MSHIKDNIYRGNGTSRLGSLKFLLERMDSAVSCLPARYCYSARSLEKAELYEEAEEAQWLTVATVNAL
jgi:hypothetical protein